MAQGGSTSQHFDKKGTEKCYSGTARNQRCFGGKQRCFRENQRRFLILKICDFRSVQSSISAVQRFSSKEQRCFNADFF